MVWDIRMGKQREIEETKPHSATMWISFLLHLCSTPFQFAVILSHSLIQSAFVGLWESVWVITKHNLTAQHFSRVFLNLCIPLSHYAYMAAFIFAFRTFTLYFWLFFFLRSSCFLPSLALALRFARSLPFHFILHLFLPFHTSLEEHTYTGIPTNRADQAIFRIIFTFALLRIKPHDIAPWNHAQLRDQRYTICSDQIKQNPLAKAAST